MIEGFLPQLLDEAATSAAVEAAIVSAGAVTMKDMGKVMAALKAAHGAQLDMAVVNRLVKAKLG